MNEQYGWFAKSLGSSGIHTSVTAVNERLIKQNIKLNMFLNIYTVNDIKIAARVKKTWCFRYFCRYIPRIQRNYNGKKFSINKAGYQEISVGKIISILLRKRSFNLLG